MVGRLVRRLISLLLVSLLVGRFVCRLVRLATPSLVRWWDCWLVGLLLVGLLVGLGMLTEGVSWGFPKTSRGGLLSAYYKTQY